MDEKEEVGKEVMAILDESAPTQAVVPVAVPAPTPPRPPRSGRLFVVLLLVLLAGSGGGGYWWWQRQPITPTQQKQLTAMVTRLSDRSGRTPQAIWETVKKDLQVRRIEDIQRGDFTTTMDKLARQL